MVSCGSTPVKARDVDPPAGRWDWPCGGRSYRPGSLPSSLTTSSPRWVMLSQFSEVASYLPGRKVEGIVVRDGRVRVQIRSRWAVPVPALAAEITTMLAPLTRNRPVDVVIADIDDPPGAPAPRVRPGAGRSRPGPGLPPLQQPGAPGSPPSGCE